jgi:hypothetical protein
MTSRIDVAVIDNGNKKMIWSKGKAETENNHATIISDLKAAL